MQHILTARKLIQGAQGLVGDEGESGRKGEKVSESSTSKTALFMSQVSIASTVRENGMRLNKYHYIQ